MLRRQPGNRRRRGREGVEHREVLPVAVAFETPSTATAAGDERSAIDQQRDDLAELGFGPGVDGAVTCENGNCATRLKEVGWRFALPQQT